MTPPEATNGALDGRFRSPDARLRLAAWQDRLAEHFTRLAESRQVAGWPVFALEHGLDVSERGLLARDVQECAPTGLSRDVSLPWIVYAAEIGYEYSGLEYWPTFAQKTPDLDKRHFTKISTLFAGFAQSYHGAVPDGPWAFWFRHIAWPITHGILPRDLQRQLAELLYDASLTFRADTFSSAEALGHHLQLRCFDYSSRFRKFAENGTLLGQIALALLLQDAGDASDGAAGAILHMSTLARIVDDLNHERDTRQWLADARLAARNRVRGLSRIPLRSRSSDAAPISQRGTESLDDNAALPRPRFLLREESPDQWTVRVQLPNLANLAERSTRSRDVLWRTQGRVAGATVPILATGSIVRDAAPTKTLAVWPSPGTQLLTFDGAPPELNAVLRASLRINMDELWLFSIGNDGQAHELATRALRAGSSYLLLRKTKTPNPAAGLRPVQIKCDGIYGLRIDVPRDVSDALVDVLSILGLEVSRELEVWPAGLPVPDWSGDGEAIFVAGQPIVLGIRSDRRLMRLTVTIDDVRLPEFGAAADASSDDPMFLQLPQLRPGSHRVAIAVTTTDDGTTATGPLAGSGRTTSTLGGELSCLVREPRTAAAGQAGALSFAVHPSAPSLEDVWEDRVEIHVAAPGTTSLRSGIVLRDPRGKELFNRRFALPSPCNTEAWRREFAAVRKLAEAKYDDAQSCVLDFDAVTLGRGRVIAERDFTPLRWAVRANGHRAVLIDSQGCTDLSIGVHPCAAPALAQPRDSATALEGIDIGDGGALVVARSGRLEVATVVVPQQRMGSLAALSGERPSVPITARAAPALTALARTTALWEAARLAGSSLAGIRRTAAVEALVARICGVVAGGRWADAEEMLRNHSLQAAVDTMRGLVATRADERAVGLMLAERVTLTADASLVEAERALLEALTPFVRIQNLEGLATYALRLVASPAQARALVEGASTGHDREARERTLFDGLLACPVIVRAARYFVVATRAVVQARGLDRRALPWGN